MGMRLDDLHAIIDNTQMGNRDTEFEVALVDLAGEKAKVYQVEEVYVDAAEGVISLVFSGDNQVGVNKDKEDVNV